MHSIRTVTDVLPRHPRTGLQAVGYRRDGRPIWPILGGSQPTGEPTPTPPTTPPAFLPPTAPAAPPAEPPKPAPPANKPADPPADGDISSLPDWAQKLIKDARADAGKARTDAKTKAADDARDNLVNQLGKVLGFVKDDGDKLTAEQLTAKLDASTKSATRAAVELAVFRGAGKHGGDPEALLDSRAFLDKVHALDVDAKDFATQLDAAIKAAVESNDKLKATGQAPPPKSGNPLNPTPGATGRPTSLGAAISSAYGKP